MQPFFLPADAGQRFCMFHPARGGQARGAVLYVHPWAEEMNKSRRMAAVQARQLARAGYAVLQIDLLGCGDSSGDFGEASWAAWKRDVLLACRWLAENAEGPLLLWGLRMGCLLVAEVASELPTMPVLVFWQPVLSGKQHWQQFMRLKAAGELASGQGKAVLDELRGRLEAGQPVEIAGYTVAAELAAGLEQAELLPPAGPAGRVVWCEVSARPEATLGPASLKRVEQWRSAGFQVDAAVVPGPVFWQTNEIEEAPQLLEATLAALGAGR